MRVAFFGTPDVAVPGLEAVLASEHDVVVVVTQPDRARGRSKDPIASDVKRRAVEADLPLLQPGSPKEEGFADALAAYAPEVLAVIAYGHILPRAVLGIAPAMNVHFSLLPAYRGAAPVQRAIMDGVTETGVSVFMLEPTVDTGPVVGVERIAVAEQDTSGDILARLAPVGAALLVRALDGMAAQSLSAQEQDDALASPAPKITSEDLEVDWTASAARVANLIRALAPRPGARTGFRKGKRLLIWRAEVVDATGEPGSFLASDGGLIVACGTGAVRLLEVQPEGKRRMSGEEFVRGYRPEPGRPLGSG